MNAVVDKREQHSSGVRSEQCAHYLISGTGRSGTTFLVVLLTHLGFDTGFDLDALDDGIRAESKAGLEFDIRNSNCPYIVKSPWFCRFADDALSSGKLQIEHVLIPIRDLYAAAESRRRVTRESPGTAGLWLTDSFDDGVQEGILTENLYRLVFTLTRHEVPFSFIEYPRLVLDARYLYSGLGSLVANIPFHEFNEVFEKVRRPEWVGNYRRS